jgi:hypothetical protein
MNVHTEVADCIVLLFGATDWSLHRVSVDVGAAAGAHHWLAATEHGEYIPQ